MLLRRKSRSDSGARGQANANGDTAREKTEDESEDCQRLSTAGRSTRPRTKSNFFKSLREHWRKRKAKLGAPNSTGKCSESSAHPEANSRKVNVCCAGSSSLAAPDSPEASRNDANDNYVSARVGSSRVSECGGADGGSETPRRNLPPPSFVTSSDPDRLQVPVTSGTEHLAQGEAKPQRTSCASDQAPAKGLSATNHNRCSAHQTSGHSGAASPQDGRSQVAVQRADDAARPASSADASCSRACASAAEALPPRQPVASPPEFVAEPDGREDPRISSLSEELFKLSKHGWYWGPITRGEAEEKLADQPDGAFLVRDSSDDRYLLSLTFKSYGKTLHTRIEHCNGLFSFYAQSGPEGRACIVDLIQESMNYSQSGVFCYSRGRTPGVPSFPVRLIKPVSRLTHVRTLQYLCRFVIRQYTRFDHIQRLPLPSRIKGYLEEGHY